MPDSWLVLEARFHNGVYRGAEWPPSPFRLLQAIVAGNRSIAAPGLAWMERQPAPDILAAEEAPVLHYTIYVPNNTDRRKTDGATAGRDVLERRVSVPVQYFFRIGTEADREDAARLIDSAARVHTFGSGQDLASVSGRLTDVAPTSREGIRHFVPQPASGLLPLRSTIDCTLRVPAPGSLESLEARFQAGQRRLDKEKGWFSPVLPPGRHDLVIYCPAGLDARLAMIPLKFVRSGNPKVLRPFDPRNIVVVAGQLRGAVMRLTQQSPVADFAAGYATDAGADRRLSWAPLPSIGHEHVDGLVRRAALLAPAACLPEMAALLNLVGSDSLPLIDEESGELVAEAVLADPDDGVFAAYRSEGRTWTSVTPVILPGDHAEEPRLVRNLILKALRNAGIDAGLLVDLAVNRVPFLPQAHHVAEYRLKAWKAGRLIPYHVRLQFREPVRGPVLLGRGRHFGLGVCCANRE